MELPFIGIVYSILKQCWSVGYVSLLTLSFIFPLLIQYRLRIQSKCSCRILKSTQVRLVSSNVHSLHWAIFWPLTSRKCEIIFIKMEACSINVCNTYAYILYGVYFYIAVAFLVNGYCVFCTYTWIKMFGLKFRQLVNIWLISISVGAGCLSSCKSDRAISLVVFNLLTIFLRICSSICTCKCVSESN